MSGADKARQNHHQVTKRFDHYVSAHPNLDARTQPEKSHKTEEARTHRRVTPHMQLFYGVRIYYPIYHPHV